MTHRISILAPFLAICLTACHHPGAPAHPDLGGPTTAGASPQAAVPLSTKEILKLLLANGGVSLKVDASCAGVGSDVSDATIGDYLSGLLAYQSQRSGQNWIEVTCEPQPASAPIRFWKCSVVFHRINGEERGGWGVTFLVDAPTRTVLRDSFRCTGAG
jgi:hypothetical protein